MSQNTQLVPTFVFRGQSQGITTVQLSPGSTSEAGSLWCGDSGGNVSVLDLASRRLLKKYSEYHSNILSLHLLGDHVFSQGREGTIKEWDASTGSVFKTTETNGHDFSKSWVGILPSLSHSPVIASTSRDPRIIQIWDSQDRNVVRTIDTSQQPKKIGMCMALKMVQGPASPMLLAGHEDGGLYLWDIRNNSIIAEMATDWKEPMLCFDLISDNTQGICGGASESLVKLDMDLIGHPAITLTQSIPVSQRGSNAVHIRKDKKIFASAGWDHRVRVFSWKTGKPLAILKYHTLGVSSLAFSDVDNLMVSASQDCKIALWNLY